MLCVRTRFGLGNGLRAAIGAIVLLYGGCGTSPTGSNENSPPALEGPDSVDATIGDFVQLDFGGSSDPDGDELRFGCVQTEGPEAILQGVGSTLVKFTAPCVPQETVLMFEFSATDGLDDAKETVEVHIHPPTTPPASLASLGSTFDSNDEDWRCVDGQFGSSARPIWNGVARRIEARGGGDWYWLAPPKLRGNLCSAYGRTLSFRVSGGPRAGSCPNSAGTGNNAVILNGAGITLAVSLLQATPTETGTTYSFVLDESSQWRELQSSAPVTHEQFVTVLARVDQLKIRGAYYVSSPSAVNCSPVLHGLDDVEIR